jgi:hypothetical protein
MGQWHSVAALQVLLPETRRVKNPVATTPNVQFAPSQQGCIHGGSQMV